MRVESLLTILRRMLQAGLWLAAVVFFALFIVGLANSSTLNSFWVVAQLRSLGNPTVRLVGTTLGIAAGTVLAKFIPLVLSAATVGLLVLIDFILAKVSVSLTLAAARRRIAAAQAAAPRPAAAEQPRQAPRPSAEKREKPRPEARSTPRPEPGPKPRVAPAPTPEPPRIPPRPAEAPADEVTRLLDTAPPAPDEVTRLMEAPAAGGGSVRVEEVAVGTPKKVGRYEILQELGRGAMGVVYKGRDPLLQRTVAIKEILTASLSGDDLARYKQRFFREAEVAARMNHPDIVTIYDVGEDQANGQPYLVMEFVEGQTLEAMMEDASGPLPLETSLEIGLKVARALEYAHRKGVVHRDIKPANIMVLPDGEIEIMDLGIARLEGSQMTRTGQLMGTPAYMSPEQFTGATVDGRADLFSLGIVLYQLLTGRLPFLGETVTEIIVKIVQNIPPPPRELNSSLPPGVDALLYKCLAKTPDERFQSAGEVAAALEALKESRSESNP